MGSRFVFLLVCLSALLVTHHPSLITSALAGSNRIFEQGKNIFEQACTCCHGTEGDGNGTASGIMRVRPRDFTTGKFKIRSTPDDSLPADEDLFRTLTNGFADYGMPSFGYLSEEERRALVSYIKTFSPHFQTRRPKAPVALESSPPVTRELLSEGKRVYEEVAECAKCHGSNGRGSGPSADTLKDDWKHPIRPVDFTRGPRAFKRGATPDDIAMTVMTGLVGTPMPSFSDTLTQRQAWAVAHYVVQQWVQPAE